MPDVLDDIPGIAEMSTQAAGAEMTETPTFDAPKEQPKEVVTETPKDAPKEAPKTEGKEQHKPADKPKEAPKVEAKKDPKDDTLGDDFKNSQAYKLANKQLRNTLDRFAKERDEWKTKASEFETSSKTSAEKIAEFEKKIQAIESKPVETKADTALVEKYETQIKELKQSLRGYDYQGSDDFKRDHSIPFEKAYKKAIEEVTQLNVTKDGQETPATDKDFAYLRALPFGPRRQAARAMFGEDYDIVLQHVSTLEKMRESAIEAINNEKNNYELRQQESTVKQQKEKEEYANALKQSEKEILETVEGFKFSDDPEEKKAWEAGMAFVEHALNNVASLPTNERAAHAAAVKLKAALYDLDQHRIKGFTAKIKSLTEELEKFRASDPGAGGEKGAAEEGAEEIGGIADMLAKAPEGWGR